MKIFIQDRRAVIDLPKDVWATQVPSGGYVCCTCHNFPYIGEYSTYERSLEVVHEIFEYYRNGKSSYIAPKE